MPPPPPPSSGPSTAASLAPPLPPATTARRPTLPRPRAGARRRPRPPLDPGRPPSSIFGLGVLLSRLGLGVLLSRLGPGVLPGRPLGSLVIVRGRARRASSARALLLRLVGPAGGGPVSSLPVLALVASPRVTPRRRDRTLDPLPLLVVVPAPPPGFELAATPVPRARPRAARAASSRRGRRRILFPRRRGSPPRPSAPSPASPVRVPAEAAIPIAIRAAPAAAAAAAAAAAGSPVSSPGAPRASGTPSAIAAEARRAARTTTIPSVEVRLPAALRPQRVPEIVASPPPSAPSASPPLPRNAPGASSRVVDVRPRVPSFVTSPVVDLVARRSAPHDNHHALPSTWYGSIIPRPRIGLDPLRAPREVR